MANGPSTSTCTMPKATYVSAWRGDCKCTGILGPTGAKRLHGAHYRYTAHASEGHGSPQRYGVQHMELHAHLYCRLVAVCCMRQGHERVSGLAAVGLPVQPPSS